MTPRRTCLIVEGGLFTTVQDLGRIGFQRFGVPVSGAMDPFALRAANRLVGNDDHTACLEITLVGPEIAFTTAARIAITGGDLGPSIDARPIRLWHAVEVPAGARLGFSGRCQGMRAYLACAGGFDVPVVLGSRSTFTRSALGGFQGRALKAGDELPLGKADAGERGRRFDRRLVPRYGDPQVVRVVLGPQHDAFTAEGLAAFLESEFVVSAHSDRIGCRLQGPVITHRTTADIVSDGTAFGSVQVSGDGQPIVLMADRGTTGGYTKIATVISADLMWIAQAAPGDRVRFRAIARDEALEALREQEARLETMIAVQERPAFEKPDGPVFDEDGADAYLAEASAEFGEALRETGGREGDRRQAMGDREGIRRQATGDGEGIRRQAMGDGRQGA
ncbi:MAG: biotin-dependent carboxyltransferase family protein [Acidobacteriota bacterium]